MQPVRYLLLTALLLLSCGASAQRIERMPFAQLAQRVQGVQDSTVVLNFWATWCKPCIEELPYFDLAAERHPDHPIKVVLVNLDFNSRVASLAEPFVSKRGLKSAVWHPDDTDPNTWINRIDSSWSGAIPATAIYREGKKVAFHEGALTEAELDALILRVARTNEKN